MSAAEIRERTTHSRETADACIADTAPDGDSVLEFFPLAVRRVRRRDNKDEASVTRVGCSVITSISTSSAGLEAIRLLQRGYSVREASNELARRFQSTQIDLQPLLTALARARMIRTINGRVISREPVSRWRHLRHRVELVSIALRRATVPFVIRFWPTVWAHGILFGMKPGWPRRKQRAVRDVARRNMEAVSDLPGGGALDTIAERYAAEQIRIGIDLDLLTHLSEVRVARWLRRHCAISGLEHLDAALAKGKGVVLCSFHFSSSHSLLVLVLWLRGYSFTGEGNITKHNTARPLPWDNPGLAAKLGGCGQVKWYTSVHFASALGICRTLARGGMALVFPDGFFVRPPQQVSTYFGHAAAEYEPAHEKLRVLGRTLEVNTGVPWICQQSEAPVILVRMRRVRGARFTLEIGPELSLTRGASVRQTAEELYAELERQIKTDPAAWFYWHKLDRFSAAGEQR